MPPHDVLVVLGDFNAVPGTSSGDGIIGPHGSGTRNDNSDRMITYCGMHNLILPGTWFRRLDIRRWTWYSHDGFTKKESDHIITRERDKGLFKSYRTFRGAEAPANTDHVLLAAELCLTLSKPRKHTDSPKPFDTPRLLEDNTLQQQYSVTVQNKFDQLTALPDDVNDCWNSFCSVIQSSANEVIGTKKRTRQPWLSADTFEIIEQKAAAKNQNNPAERKRLQGVFKAKAKLDREAYLTKIVEDVEADLLSNRMGSVFKAINYLAGKTSTPGAVTIHKADNSPCQSEDEVLERWREHFEAALNHSPDAQSTALDDEAVNTPSDTVTTVDEPSLGEVTAAIKRLRNGRAPGSDGIPAELLKCAIEPVARMLHFLFIRVWRTGHIPLDWRDGIIITLYKGKGQKSDCGSYRPITLLSVPGKVFAHVLLARIQPLLDMTRRPQQSGFAAGRSTIDAILALRLLSEIHREFNRPLQVAYLDIKAAFDSVDRQALWKALRGRGVPDVLLNLIAALHNNTGARVRCGKNLSSRFSTTSGVRQGCILAPALFCVAIDWIIAHMANKPGITVGNSQFTDLVYADDTALLVQSPSAAATCLSSFSEAASTLGLHISWPKTKLQNVGQGTQSSTDITVDGNPVEHVESFVYLGSVQSSEGQCLPDVKRRIALASSVMASLKKIWRDRRLSLPIKIRTYKALVLSTLLYAAETWTLRVEDSRILESFHMKCQRQILGIKWQDHVRNVEVAIQTGLPPVMEHIVKRRNSIFGHIARMPHTVPANQALRCQIDLSLGRPPDKSWKRRPGRPNKRWLDQIRDDNSRPPADVWRDAVRRGHSGATQRSSPTTR